MFNFFIKSKTLIFSFIKSFFKLNFLNTFNEILWNLIVREFLINLPNFFFKTLYYFFMKIYIRKPTNIFFITIKNILLLCIFFLKKWSCFLLNCEQNYFKLLNTILMWTYQKKQLKQTYRLKKNTFYWKYFFLLKEFIESSYSIKLNIVDIFFIKYVPVITNILKFIFFHWCKYLFYFLMFFFNLSIYPLVFKLCQWYLFTYIIWIILLLILFNYFQTIYKFSKWTSQIKFFWIRTFTIFWGLEFYLLGIFIFLFIISPDEFKYFFFITKTIFESVPNNITVESYIMILFLLLIINLNVYSIVYRSLFIINIITALLLILILMILINEINSYNTYASISNYKNNINKSVKIKLLNFSQSSIEYKIINNYCQSNSLTVNNILKQRPSTIILNIILVVKFYHVYTIIILTTILLVVNIWSNKNQSLEMCAFITQNLIILLLFYSLNYVIYYKFFYKYIIYGFYTNISLSYTTMTEMSYILEFFQNELLFHFVL